MEYRQLGRTGLLVSAIGFGCGNTGGLLVRGSFEEQCSAVACALEGGINYFDTAAQYGDGRSEENLGRVLADLGASPYVGTKLRVEPDEVQDVGTAVRRKLEEGLRRLRRDRVDICILHTRVGLDSGGLPASAVLGPVAGAMRDLVADGLTGAIGFTGLGETTEICAVAASGCFDVFQCYYNLLNQSASVPGSPDGIAQDFNGVLDIAVAHGTAAVGIRALAGGALSEADGRHPLASQVGRPMASGEEYGEDRRRAGRYRDHLADLGISSLSELAFRFALTNKNLSTVLAGFSDQNQVEEELKFASLGPLAASTLTELGSLKF